MDLIKEAKKRGYRKGVAIRYVPHEIDYVEGNFFEVNENGCVVAYAKHKKYRTSFEDEKHDTLYDAFSKEWVEIVNKE